MLPNLIFPDFAFDHRRSEKFAAQSREHSVTIHDGKPIGVLVHVTARWTMDTAPNIARAAQSLGRADVSASSSINLVSLEHGTSAAMTVELYPGGPSFVLPNEPGVLTHTNHFLASGLDTFDTEPTDQHETLSTIGIDLAKGELHVHAGGPCSHPSIKRV